MPENNLAEISDIVADAIMYGYAQGVRRALHGKSEAAGHNLREVAQESTEGECRKNSMRAAYLIWSKYRDRFPVSLLITSDIRSLSEKHFKRGDWKYHSGLLLQDETRMWHYISPANHTQSDTGDSPLLTHLTAQNLSELLSKIQQLEAVEGAPSLFPSDEEIAEYLATHPDGRTPGLNKRDPSRYISIPEFAKEFDSMGHATLVSHTQPYEIPPQQFSH